MTGEERSHTMPSVGEGRSGRGPFGAAIEVVPSGPATGQLAAPTSKSVTNRLLIVAALASGVSMLRDPLVSDDSQSMLDAIAAFGAGVEVEAGVWRVTGTAGEVRTPTGPVDAGLSGTTMRFVTGLAALTRGPATVTGAPPLLRRPVGPLTAALAGLGADVRDHDGYPPVAAGGGLDGGSVTVDATASSQFASAVLLVAPYARRDVTVDVRGAIAGGYVDLTAAVIRDWGGRVDRQDGTRWRVTAGHRYTARDCRVEYDASAAAHLLALAAATGGAVTVTNAAPDTFQPDAGLIDVLAAMGCTIERHRAAVTATGPAELAPVDVDVSAMPDQVTTVAALAALADGRSTITGAAVTRGHETDRLAALAGELAKLGVAVEERPDGLVVHGGTARGPARLDTHDDHRLAMAFAAVAARVPGIVITEPGCVTKTYPGFWVDLDKLGVRWAER